MANHQPLPDRMPVPAPGAAEARQLAETLRRSRLTLLCGAAGAGKSALLVDGLLPLLRRRSADAAISVAQRAPEPIMPFPERRPRNRAALVELVVFLDARGAASQASLHNGIDAALRAAGVDPEWHREPLTERVQSLASRFGSRFLFVLDGFEVVLKASANDTARAAMIDDLVHLLNLPVPANLLIALRSDMEPLLAPMRDRLHVVRSEVLMLEGGRVRRVDGPAAPPVAAPKPAPTGLSQFDRDGLQEAANTGAPTRPGDIGAARAASAVTPRPVPSTTAPSRHRRSAPRRLAVLASVAIAAIGGAAMLFWPVLPSVGARAPASLASSGSVPQEAAPVIAAALPAVPTAPPVRAAPAAAPTANPALAPPTVTLQVDAASVGARLPRELAQALGADGGATLQIVPTSQALPGPAASSGLAIVRYDALQSALRTHPGPELAIVAPLYTEEVQVFVRTDSPLAFIHQIEGRRINVGAPQGARALTAQALYRQMFGRPLPASPLGQLGEAAALQRLAAGDGIDAVWLVAPASADVLAGLSATQRRGLKLLRLDPTQAASRRALQGYLPATLRDAGGQSTPTLAAMSFLVTRGPPDSDARASLAHLATSLCRHLPELQRDGDPKWREMRAGLQLETGWPQAAAAETAWRACAGGGVATASTASNRLSPSSPRN